MALDFRANQVRANKVIVSGSTGTNASLLLYSFSASSDLIGGINPAKFDTTSIGSDVFFFISGSRNSLNISDSHGTTLVGGDLYISGNLVVKNNVTFLGTASFAGPVTASNTFLFTNTASFTGPVTASNTFLFTNTASFTGPVTASNIFVSNDLYVAGIIGFSSGNLIPNSLATTAPFLQLVLDFPSTTGPLEVGGAALNIKTADGVNHIGSAGTAGGNLELLTGVGGDGTLTGSAGMGGTLSLMGGDGGMAVGVAATCGHGGEISIIGGNGGESTDQAFAGLGAGIVIAGGVGGAYTGTFSAIYAGATGGSVAITTGLGGNGTLLGGTGGGLDLLGGNGGNSIDAAGTPGLGGDINLKGGYAGEGPSLLAPVRGGNLVIAGGAGSFDTVANITSGPGGHVSIFGGGGNTAGAGNYHGSIALGSITSTRRILFFHSPSIITLGSDVHVAISGSIGSQGVSASYGTTLIGGDLYVSGNLIVKNNVTFSGTASFAGPVTASNTFLFSGTASFAAPITASQPALFSSAVNFTNGLSGSLTKLSNGTSFIISGPGTRVNSASNGAITISGSAGTYGRLFVAPYTSTIAIITSPQVCGQNLWDPTEFGYVQGTSQVFLKAILSAQLGSEKASIKLFNVTEGVYVDIGGVGIPYLETSVTTPTKIISGDLSSAANFFDSIAKVYEVQIYTSNVSSTTFLGSAELLTLITPL